MVYPRFEAGNVTADHVDLDRIKRASCWGGSHVVCARAGLHFSGESCREEEKLSQRAKVESIGRPLIIGFDRLQR